MNIESIGKVIAVLRKEKGATQEELAKSVGVSPQAVSKWECGGLPDTELLPAIADFFGISIDALFDRRGGSCGDLKTEIAMHIASFEQEQRFEAAMEYCWAIEKAIGGIVQSEKTLKNEMEIIKDSYQHSQMLFQNGFATFSLTNKLPYFCIFPEPAAGWQGGLFEQSAYTNFFKLLGEPNVMDCLSLLYKRENKPFTPMLFEKQLKLSAERTQNILNWLKPYGLISEIEIELNDAVQKVYNFNPNPSFIALLAITKELIERPNAFTYFCGSRGDKPYL